MSFLTYLRRDLEQILFKDRDPHAIPSMDGAFSPNDRLDRTTPIGEPLPGADAVAEAPDGAICVSAGNKIWRFSGSGYQDRTVLAEFDCNVGALTFDAQGRLFTCTARGLALLDNAGNTTKLVTEAESVPSRCLTAIASAPDGTIFVSDGSTRHGAEDWRVDLMEGNRLGRVIACEPGLNEARVLLRGLNYPAGLAVADGHLWFTEGFAHRLSRAPIVAPATIGAPQIVIRNMPGYPSRLSRTRDGGFWLSLFAVRTHLVEFVLREDDFRREMMRTIPQAYWVSPALSSGSDCLEPLQVGGLRALGIEKPWAPPRSYGLLARLDSDGEVVETLHSRVGGRYHGITAAIETAQGAVVISKGSGRVLLHRAETRQ
jgi:sugar lactone lactonase YvrE